MAERTIKTIGIQLVAHNRGWFCRSVLVAMLLLELVACKPRFTPQLVKSPMSVPRAENGAVDIRALVSDVQKEVLKTLPDAYLNGIVFAGRGRDLLELNGRIVLVFTEVRFFLSGRQVITGIATIETETETMEILFVDDTGHYPSIRRLDPQKGLSVPDIAAIGYARLADEDLLDCDVTLTRLENTWSLICGAIGTLERTCEFEIDPSTGQVITLKQ